MTAPAAPGVGRADPARPAASRQNPADQLPAHYESGCAEGSVADLAALSEAALRYGERLTIDDVPTVARRLYGYGSIPWSPRWERRCGDEAVWLGVLGLQAGGALRTALTHYRTTYTDGWLSWSRMATVPRPELPFKLYVSPQPAAVASVFAAVARIFAESDVPAFKLGRGAPGVLRPDKIVAYLPDAATVASLGAALGRRLDGVVAQGVPFTAPLTSLTRWDPSLQIGATRSIVSWGMDPRDDPTVRAIRSWRSFVCLELAAGIIAARRADPSAARRADPSFAPGRDVIRERLALAGVDAATFSPLPQPIGASR